MSQELPQGGSTLSLQNGNWEVFQEDVIPNVSFEVRIGVYQTRVGRGNQGEGSDYTKI